MVCRRLGGEGWFREDYIGGAVGWCCGGCRFVVVSLMALR